MFDDAADVFWTMGTIEGTAFVAIEAPGPVMASVILTLDIPQVRVGVLFPADLEDADPMSAGVLAMYLDTPDQPLLAVPWKDPVVTPFLTALGEGRSWLLFLQCESQGVPMTRTIHVSPEGTATPVGEVLPRRVVQMF